MLRRGNKARSNTCSNMAQSNTASAVGDDSDSLISGGPDGSLQESLVRSLPLDDEQNLVEVGRKSPFEEEDKSIENIKLQKKMKKGGCWSNFKTKCGVNGGFNLLTYALLLSFFNCKIRIGPNNKFPTDAIVGAWATYTKIRRR